MPYSKITRAHASHPYAALNITLKGCIECARFLHEGVPVSTSVENSLFCEDAPVIALRRS